LATRALPTIPAAAPTFSATIGCPRSSPSFAAWMRALVSTPPPAAKGTISMIGRLGQPCAKAGAPGTSAARIRYTA